MVEGDPLGDATALPSERESASRMFLTTIDAETKVKQKEGSKKPHQKFRTLESTSAGPRIVEHHQDLTTLAQTLDQRMNTLLQEHEKDFFLAYKTHMYTVQKEIKTLRMKADHEEAKTREDTKIKALEGELDWFVQEAVRLDELCRGYKKEVDKWKAKAGALDEDRRFLEDQIKGAKRQNKVLRAAAERARSSAYSALLATRAKAEALENGEGGYPPARDPGQLALLPGMELAQGQGGAQTGRSGSHRRPRSAGGGAEATRPAAGSGARRALEARSRTPDGLQLQQSASSRALALQSAAAASPKAGAGSPLARSVLGIDAEERYVEAIQHLKESIAREQQTVRMLQAARSSSYSRKSEMEEFFLRCIDEAKKDLLRRQHLATTKERERTEHFRAQEAVLTNEDVLVSLYEKLFPHRTGMARSLGGPFAAEERFLQHMPLENGHTQSH